MARTPYISAFKNLARIINITNVIICEVALSSIDQIVPLTTPTSLFFLKASLSYLKQRLDIVKSEIFHNNNFKSYHKS